MLSCWAYGIKLCMNSFFMLVCFLHKSHVADTINMGINVKVKELVVSQTLVQLWPSFNTETILHVLLKSCNELMNVKRGAVNNEHSEVNFLAANILAVFHPVLLVCQMTEMQICCLNRPSFISVWGHVPETRTIKFSWPTKSFYFIRCYSTQKDLSVHAVNIPDLEHQNYMHCYIGS